MLSKILNLEGVTSLSKSELKNIKGAESNCWQTTYACADGGPSFAVGVACAEVVNGVPTVVIYKIGGLMTPACA